MVGKWFSRGNFRVLRRRRRLSVDTSKKSGRIYCWISPPHEGPCHDSQHTTLDPSMLVSSNAMRYSLLSDRFIRQQRNGTSCCGAAGAQCFVLSQPNWSRKGLRALIFSMVCACSVSCKVRQKRSALQGWTIRLTAISVSLNGPTSSMK